MYKLTEQQKTTIESDCLSALCENMSFPSSERLQLSDLIFDAIQGCNISRNDAIQAAASWYLADLFAATL